jgi:hypothetical protein
MNSQTSLKLAYTVGDSARIAGRSAGEGLLGAGAGALSGGAIAALLTILQGKKQMGPGAALLPMAGAAVGSAIGNTHGAFNAMANADKRHEKEKSVKKANTLTDDARIAGRTGLEGAAGAGLGAGAGFGTSMLTLSGLAKVLRLAAKRKGLAGPVSSIAGAIAPRIGKIVGVGTEAGAIAGGLTGGHHGFQAASQNAQQRHLSPGLIPLLKQKLGMK